MDEIRLMPFQPGQLLNNKYEVINLVGVGGVGFVVAAYHTKLGEKVALKFLRPEMLSKPDVVSRFEREARAAVKIKNEHVVRVLDVSALPDGKPFIVMEYLFGRDLFAVISQDGPRPVAGAVDYVLQICEALAEAHACGIVHRDIKPENLFVVRRLDGSELVKVLDFGISKLALTGVVVGSSVPLASTSHLMGSPIYMSPEQIRATGSVDSRTDIWSIGCVLYELLGGTPAFDAPTLTQLSASILESDPRSLSQDHAHIPAEIDRILARCLEKDPDRRFQTVAELALALHPYATWRSRLSVEHCCLTTLVDARSTLSSEDCSSRPSVTSTPNSEPVHPEETVPASGIAREEPRSTFRRVNGLSVGSAVLGMVLGSALVALLGLGILRHNRAQSTSSVCESVTLLPPTVHRFAEPRAAPDESLPLARTPKDSSPPAPARSHTPTGKNPAVAQAAGRKPASSQARAIGSVVIPASQEELDLDPGF